MTVAELKVKLGITGERDVTRGLERVRDGLTRTAGAARVLGGGLASAFSPIVRMTSLVGALGGALLAVSAFNEARSFDSMIRGLATVSGNVEGLTRRLAAARQIAKLPGLGLGEAIGGQLGLESVGINEQLSQRLIGGIGNALASVGRGKAELDGVVLALSQIASKGKVSAEEINQIAERMPQIRNILIQMFGTADTEQIQRLGLSSQSFFEGIAAGLERLPRVSGGIQNTIDNLIDLGKNAIRPLGQGIAELLESLSGLAERGLAAFEARMRSIGEVLAAVGTSGAAADALGKLFSGLEKLSGANGAADFATRLSAGILAVVANIPTMIQYVSDLFGVIGQNIEIAFQNARRELQLLGLEARAELNEIKGLLSFSLSDRRAYAAEADILRVMRDMVAGSGDPIAYKPLPQRPNLTIGQDYNAYVAAIQANIRPLSDIPGGLTYGSAPSSAAAQGAKEAKAEGLLERIERNTKAAADGLSLRRQAIGGGQLGQLGVTPAELAAGASYARLTQAWMKQQGRLRTAAASGFRPR